MSDKIPPRPWRVEADETGFVDVLAEGCTVADFYFNRDAAEFIVRLVNAEPEIVAALEATATYFATLGALGALKGPEAFPEREVRDKVRAALEKVR